MRTYPSLLPVTFCMLVALSAQASGVKELRRFHDVSVTPVAGESWIHHLHRPFGATSMGKTGRLGPPAPPDGVLPAGWQLGVLPPVPDSVQLHGDDLYRFNCQGCHGEAGLGAPPEIHSMINPMRATSVPLVLERMKKAGMDMSPAAASELAKQAQDALLERLHNGGQSMPPFPHLEETEIRALLAYCKKLAEVPGATELTVSEPPEKIGEHIVKSTCHTCHDATGPNPTPGQLERGAIPPLETLTSRVDELQFIRKVTAGAPIMMGTPPTLHRGRMPVFYYFTREEAADVYLYLSEYRPVQMAAIPASALGAPPDAGGNDTPKPGDTPQPARPVSSSLPGEAFISAPPPSQAIPDWMVTLLLIGAAALVLGLVTGGLGFAAYELHRLGRNGERQAFHAIVRTDIDQESRRSDGVARSREVIAS